MPLSPPAIPHIDQNLYSARHERLTIRSHGHTTGEALSRPGGALSQQDGERLDARVALVLGPQAKKRQQHVARGTSTGDQPTASGAWNATLGSGGSPAGTTGRTGHGTVSSCTRVENWSGKRDSNSRPQPWQGCALPTELFPLRGLRYFSATGPIINQFLQLNSYPSVLYNIFISNYIPCCAQIYKHGP
jgi:hypothetical protein